MAHINRPGGRKRDRSEHRAIFPLRIGIGCGGELERGSPKMRMFELAAEFSTSQSSRRPVFRVLIAAGLNKFQIFVVGDRENVNRETRHRRFSAREFIVPAERSCRAACPAWRSRRESSLAAVLAQGLDRPNGEAARFFFRPANCATDRPAFPRASGDARWPHAAGFRPKAPGSAELQRVRSCKLRIQRSRTPRLYFSTARCWANPLGVSVGKPPPTGSMPKAKSLSNSGSCRFEAQRPAQKIPIESFQMPEIKNQAMTFRDGPFVKRIRRQQFEQRIGARARLFQP